MLVLKVIAKIMLLPVLIAVILFQWIGIFLNSISGVAAGILAFLFVLTGTASLIFGLASGPEFLKMMIAASMCEGDLTKAILMNLADLIETVGITDEEMEQLLYQVRTETAENIMNMEKDYEGWTGKKSGALPWRDFARKKILATFGHDDCGTTIRRLCYMEHVMVDPDLKQIVHDLTSQIATMNVFHPEKYADLLAEARKVDELWRIKTDDLGYFTVKD